MARARESSQIDAALRQTFSEALDALISIGLTMALYLRHRKRPQEQKEAF